MIVLASWRGFPRRVWERQRVFPEIFWDVCVSLMFFKRCSPNISAKKKKKSCLVWLFSNQAILFQNWG